METTQESLLTESPIGPASSISITHTTDFAHIFFQVCEGPAVPGHALPQAFLVTALSDRSRSREVLGLEYCFAVV